MSEHDFPDYGDILEPVECPVPSREGLAANDEALPCRSCGQVHPYITGTLKTAGGEEVCGVPILFDQGVPSGTYAVEPMHGMQVLIFGQNGLRLAIVWRPDHD